MSFLNRVFHSVPDGDPYTIRRRCNIYLGALQCCRERGHKGTHAHAGVQGTFVWRSGSCAR